MHPDQIRALLEEVQAGVRTLDEAFNQLAQLPFGDLGNARVDHHRSLRCGFAEVVFAAGKEPRDVVRIVEEGLRLNPCMLATRADKRHADALHERFPNAVYNPRGNTVRVGTAPPLKTHGSVLVVTAGTSDIPVAEEVLETLRAFGCEARHCYDVGVAGLQRVLSQLDLLRSAAAIICIAGMEGALPSVVGGLVGCPVIAVPTSIGYGASFKGVAALLGMLNTCAAGVTVVNIDNGFGAAMSALRMVADRKYPLVIEERQEIRDEERGTRDEGNGAIAEQVVPTIEIQPIYVEPSEASEKRDEQYARIEKLATQLSQEKSELVARLERTVETLNAVTARPVVVKIKQPKRSPSPPPPPAPPPCPQAEIPPESEAITHSHSEAASAPVAPPHAEPSPRPSPLVPRPSSSKTLL